MQPRVGRLHADIIIEDGQVWVNVQTTPGLWPGARYAKIEELRAKDYHRPGSTGRHPGARSGRPSQWASDPGVGFDPGVDESSDRVRDDSDRLIRESINKYFADYVTRLKEM